ncbi:hypothetical protein [Thalassospira xiamenensis]|uniref:Uncharacterized protein n=1 Tax=Thalassospira xiamenensis TaxID=220697 RepID=A0A285TSX8_9PROT|nr:hypothetical protein [Thalassospira xiamenensis]SOC26937.1 hypothetical protein SAMN05428964_105236 [Thalassospira xiamenensis]
MSHASLYEIFEDAIATQGWDDNSQRVVLQRYIENQQSEAAFDDHLLQHAREVNQEHIVSSDGLESYMGWRDRDMVRIMLEYIENQQGDDSFADFIAEQVAEEEAMTTNFTM